MRLNDWFTLGLACFLLTGGWLGIFYSEKVSKLGHGFMRNIGAPKSFNDAANDPGGIRFSSTIAFALGIGILLFSALTG